MSGMNVVAMVGNLCADPELRYVGGNNTAICALRLAVNRVWYNANNEKQDEACFIDVDVWGKMGESCSEYLRKGRQVAIQGYLKYETWEDKDSGQKRSKHKIVADKVTFIGGREDGGQGGGQRQEPRQGEQRQEQRRDEPRNDQRRDERPAGGNQKPRDEGVNFDDIPF